MEIKVNSKTYKIDYTSDDASEHLYNIFLIDTEGNPMPLEDFAEDVQLKVQALVDQDAYESAIDFAEYTHGDL